MFLSLKLLFNNNKLENLEIDNKTVRKEKKALLHVLFYLKMKFKIALLNS